MGKKNRTYSLDEETRELLVWFDEHTTYNKSDLVSIGVKMIYHQYQHGEVAHPGLRGDLQVGDVGDLDVTLAENEDEGSILDKLMGNKS